MTANLEGDAASGILESNNICDEGKLKAKGFLLTQNLDNLKALDLDGFRVYQLALSELEDRCGLEFSAALKSADCRKTSDSCKDG
ncbi:MAG TPA: hypothetical protein VFD60_04400 [Nitrososphaeraceae archaeon]|nr:hypothetical protein [Nitrososphaeraceae archaeon]